MCRSAESQQARVPSSIPKPNALSLFPAVFELRSEGSVLAHTVPVDQVQGQSSFEWSVVLIMQPPFSLDFLSPRLPSLHLLHPLVPQPFKLLQSTWISFTQDHAIIWTKRPKGRQFGNMSPEGPNCRMGWGSLSIPTSTQENISGAAFRGFKKE